MKTIKSEFVCLVIVCMHISSLWHVTQTRIQVGNLFSAAPWQWNFEGKTSSQEQDLQRWLRHLLHQVIHTQQYIAIITWTEIFPMKTHLKNQDNECETSRFRSKVTNNGTKMSTKKSIWPFVDETHRHFSSCFLNLKLSIIQNSTQQCMK